MDWERLSFNFQMKLVNSMVEQMVPLNKTYPTDITTILKFKNTYKT